MLWVNHIIIAASVAAVINPVLVPAAVLGATAPDWLEWLLKPMWRGLRHRGATHYAVVWIIATIAGGVVWFAFGSVGMLAFAFSFGGLFHILTDAMTVSGVPFAWWSDRKFHLFGGKLRTGAGGEYMVSGVVVCLAMLIMTASGGTGGFVPFFFDWHSYYEKGLIDGSEWRQNRFKIL